MSDNTGAMSKKKNDGFWETIRTVIYAILVALAIRTCAYEPFNIPSGSMRPTLLIGDYLFAVSYQHLTLPPTLHV